jgi:hypothetical protein
VVADVSLSRLADDTCKDEEKLDRTRNACACYILDGTLWGCGYLRRLVKNFAMDAWEDEKTAEDCAAYCSYGYMH